MRLETEKKIYIIAFCGLIPLIIYGSINSYMNEYISLIEMTLMIIIPTIVIIFIIAYIIKHFKKKIEIRRMRH